MAQQAPWDAAPVVRQRVDPRQNEREQAETRYRNTTGDANPLAQPPILPGEEGYAGPGDYLPQAGVVVRGAWDNAPVQTESQRRAAAEAERLIPATDAVGREQSLMQGLLLNNADEFGGRIAQAGQMTRNLGRRLTGQEIEVNSSDLNDAYVETYRARQEQFARDNPGQAIGLNVAGGLLTGGATLGTGVAGLAATGAAYGAGSGYGAAEGSFAERLPQAALGAGFGGALGAGAGVAAPYAARLASVASAGTRPIREAAGRMVGLRPEPAIVGARRIADQFQRSGGDLQGARASADEYRAAGLDPAVVDVGGQNVFSTTRAAASGEGAARDRAVAFRNRRASELAPRTIERTRRLTPNEDRDALTMATDIRQTRQTEARQNYGPAYAREVVVPDEALRALRGPEGGQAMDRARRIASLEQDYQTASEIDNLMIADLDANPMASGRALEYVRRAYAGMASEAPDDLIGGFRQRMTQIDNGLDVIPELRDARRAYRVSSEQMDALGGEPNAVTGRQVLGRPNRAPMSAIGERSAPRYEAYVEGLPDTAAPANQVYQRDQLINRLAGGKEGAVGPVNSITPGFNAPLDRNAPTVARNLEATFPGEAQRYQQDLNLASRQMSVANMINPNDGSKSANVLIDSLAEDAANGLQTVNQMRGQTVLGMVAGAFQKLAQRTSSLNEAERDAIVQLGLGSADDLERIVQIAELSRRSGGPVPRAVRQYIDRARNTLGAQSPVPQQLEQLLIPSRVVAEDQQE